MFVKKVVTEDGNQNVTLARVAMAARRIRERLRKWHLRAARVFRAVNPTLPTRVGMSTVTFRTRSAQPRIGDDSVLPELKLLDVMEYYADQPLQH